VSEASVFIFIVQDKVVKNAFYAQSGGVTSVINASACGVIQTCRSQPSKIGHVYAGQHGITGALTENIYDTNQESEAAIAALRHTPAGAFGSCRYKLREDREYQRLLEVFKAHDIGYFFYNGGGDSADTSYKMTQLADRMNYPLQVIHIPKTVDNDLPLTDNCPGFGSVAKYIAVSTLEASFDVRSGATTSTQVFVLEVMGRHAGWIAAAGGLAADYDIPVVVLFPEVPFNQTDFLARVKAQVARYGYCSVVVSEGCRDSEGRFLADQGTRDAFGHAQLGGAAPVVARMIKDQLGYKYHWAVADYLQRSARHLASAVDVEQAYALGKSAVELALAGKRGVMPTIVRESATPYRWCLGEADLSDVANQEKMMPSEFISADGFGITQACKDYLYPLIQGEAYPPYTKLGLPDYVTLKKVLLPKKLAEFTL
jgi:6-phosphofructokinase 1